MESTLSCILCFCMGTFVVLNVLGSFEFSRYFPLDNYTCDTTKIVFHLIRKNRVTCAMMCYFNDDCYGVYFDHVTQECKGCSADFDDIPRPRNGSVYYARNSTHHIMKYANAQFNNKRCNESELVFHNFNMTSYQQCARACADNSMCFSYFYNPDKQECLGCQSEYSVLRTSPVLEEWAGSIYFGRFRYLGCYDNYPRILENAHTYSTGMVTELCVARCISGGYLYALTESGHWCQCGNDFSPNEKLTEDRCNSACYGNEDQFCGNSNVGSVYIL